MRHPFLNGRTPYGRPAIGRHQVLFFEPDRGTGNNGGGTDNPPADDRQQLQGLLQRHNNDAMAVVATLLAENHTYRDRIRTLTSQVPAQGTVVLTPEQAQLLSGYQQLGTVEALTSAIQTGQAAQERVTRLERDAHLREVAQVAGYEPTVLADRAGSLEIEIRTVEEQGKQVKRAFVKHDGKETPIGDYAKEHWAAYLPALQVAAQPAGASGTAFVRQSGGGTPPNTSPVANHINRTYKRAK